MSLKVSVIIPNYNHEAYLRQRLDSVFNQTYRNFDVILLDDCSSEGSVDILKEYASHEKTCDFIINKKNSGGVFKQWKKGISLSKGDLIWIAESDDWAELNFLEEMVGAFKNNTDLGIAYCQSEIIDENNNRIGSFKGFTRKFTNNYWMQSFELKGMSLISGMMNRNVIPNASGVVFKNNTKLHKPLDVIQDFKVNGDW